MRHLLAVPVVLVTCALPLSAQQKPPEHQSEAVVTYDVRLERVGAWLSRQAAKLETSKPAPDDAALKGKLNTLFGELTELQRQRAAYLLALQRVIDAREQHLSDREIARRSQSFRAETDALQRLLTQVAGTMHGIDPGISTQTDQLGKTIRIYTDQQQEAVTPTHDFRSVGGYTDRELKQLHTDVEANGANLQQAIDSLLQAVRTLQAGAGH